jgi:oligopeptide transport system substrate-binding protein
VKRNLSLFCLICLGFALVLAGCGGGSSSGASSTGTKTVEQKLVFAELDDPDSLDPGFTANTFAGPLFFTAYEGLVKYDTGNNLVPGVAKSWDISEDALTYTFHLVENAKWSDGSPLTAADFEFSWKRLLDPAFASQTAHLVYGYIKNGQAAYDGEISIDEVGIKAVNDTTLVVTLEAPCSFFTALLATWTYNPVCKAVVEKNPNWARDVQHYVSNGPFKLVDYKLGEGLYLVKNENYWNAANVKLQTLNFLIMQDLTTAFNAYEKGEIDGMIRAPSAEIPSLRSRDDFHNMPQFGNTYWLVNTTTPVLRDPRVRKALALAIDRTSLIEDVLQTSYDPVLGHVPQGYVQSDGRDFRAVGGNYGLSPRADVAEAKRLLAEAGYSDLSTFPSLRLGYYTSDTAKKVAEALQQMYKQNLGVDFKIVSAEWTVFYDQVMQLDYDICAMGDLGTYLHPMAFLFTFVGDNPPLETGWRSPEYDRLVQESLRQTDPARADALLHQAEDLFMNDFPLIPLYSGTQPLLMKTYVKNWYYSPVGAFVFDKVEIAAH